MEELGDQCKVVVATQILESAGERWGGGGMQHPHPLTRPLLPLGLCRKLSKDDFTLQYISVNKGFIPWRS
jgi:hypothetical protein